MNINLANRVSIRLVYSLVLALAAVLPISCIAQSKPKTTDAPIAQTSPSTQNANTVKCKSPEEIANFRPPSEWKGSELNHAVIYQDLTAVKKLLKQKVALDEKDNYGNTPLTNALRLPVRESKVMAPGVDEQLSRDMKKDRKLAVTMARELLKSGADVNLRGFLGNTPLIEVVSQFYSPDNIMNLLNMFIKYKPDVNLQNEQGFTALMYAARNGRTEAVKFLLARGADAKLTNCAGETALSIAQSSKSNEAISKDLIKILQGTK